MSVRRATRAPLAASLEVLEDGTRKVLSLLTRYKLNAVERVNEIDFVHLFGAAYVKSDGS